MFVPITPAPPSPSTWALPLSLTFSTSARAANDLLCRISSIALCPLPCEDERGGITMYLYLKTIALTTTRSTVLSPYTIVAVAIATIPVLVVGWRSAACRFAIDEETLKAVSKRHR